MVSLPPAKSDNDFDNASSSSIGSILPPEHLQKETIDPEAAPTCDRRIHTYISMRYHFVGNKIVGRQWLERFWRDDSCHYQHYHVTDLSGHYQHYHVTGDSCHYQHYHVTDVVLIIFEGRSLVNIGCRVYIQMALVRTLSQLIECKY